ncbi:MAG: helix-turn-helix domain-containing protein [Acidiferrobacterales bacterium]
MGPVSKTPQSVRIQALGRASAIIDVIAAGGEAGLSLGEISRATALNKTTAFNLIASLVTLGFLEQDVHSR